MLTEVLDLAPAPPPLPLLLAPEVRRQGGSSQEGRVPLLPSTPAVADGCSGEDLGGPPLPALGGADAGRARVGGVRLWGMVSSCWTSWTGTVWVCWMGLWRGTPEIEAGQEVRRHSWKGVQWLGGRLGGGGGDNLMCV